MKVLVSQEKSRGLCLLGFTGYVILFAALLLSVGCTKKEDKAPEKVVNVRIALAEKRSLRPFVESVGTLKPFEEVTVSSEVDGILKRLRVDEGSAVSKGMILAEIKETDYQLDLERAEAMLKQAVATLENTKVEYQRKESLFKEELVTKQQFDDVATRLSIAVGDVDRSKAGLSLAKEKLAKAIIYSPINGHVKEKKVTAGDYLRNGTPLMWIIQSDPIKLDFTVTEKDVGSLKIGQEVQFRVDSFPDKAFTGKLTTIYPSLEEKTRTLQVEALVPNPQKLLRPGFFARVTLYTSAPKETVVLPVTALLYEGTQIKVFIVEGDRAKEKLVKIGGKYGDYMEITEGLTGGEQVVVVGQNNLSEGLKINVAR